MTVKPIPPWFVKRLGPGWRITARGWLALILVAVLMIVCLSLLRGIERVILGSLIIMVFLALSVGKIDMRRFGLD